ncbi:MAG: hypothetical protein WCE44_04415 [Candidatus Velthaea sp.]|jgi:hypothetical protein
MARYEFKVVTIDRHHLRSDEPVELQRLNEEGAQGWHIIAIRDDPRNNSHLVFYLERERPESKA